MISFLVDFVEEQNRITRSGKATPRPYVCILLSFAYLLHRAVKLSRADSQVSIKSSRKVPVDKKQMLAVGCMILVGEEIWTGGSAVCIWDSKVPRIILCKLLI